MLICADLKFRGSGTEITPLSDSHPPGSNSGKRFLGPDAIVSGPCAKRLGSVRIIVRAQQYKTIFLCWAVFLDKLYGTGLDSSTKVKSGVWERSPHNGDTEGANGAHECAAKLSGKKDQHPQTSGIAHTVVGAVGCHVLGSFSYRGSISKISEISGFYSWFSLVS
jgi:hypothetical protein